MVYFIQVHFTILTLRTCRALDTLLKNQGHFSRSTQSHSRYPPISLIFCHDFVIESFVYPNPFERESFEFPSSRHTWPSCLASGTRRANIRPTGTGRRAARARRALGARRRGHHPTCELRQAAHPHSPAVAFGARRNSICRLLALRADGRLLCKRWTDWFECFESTVERSNVELKYTSGICGREIN